MATGPIWDRLSTLAPDVLASRVVRIPDPVHDQASLELSVPVDPTPVSPPPYLRPHRRITTGNQVKFLMDGAETFQEMAAAIATANANGHFIILINWFLDDGLSLVPGGPSILSLFKAASNSDVDIRAML